MDTAGYILSGSKMNEEIKRKLQIPRREQFILVEQYRLS
jgi:hypothetical protein